MVIRLLPADKATHAVAGSIAALVGVFVGRYFGLPPAMGAAACCAFAGLAKELYDWEVADGVPELGDLLATIGGGLPVVFTAFVLTP